MVFVIGFFLLALGVIWAKLCASALGPIDIAGIEIRRMRWHEYVAAAAICVGLLLVACSGLMLAWRWLP